MMSLLTELKIILRKNFYKYVAPTALLPPVGNVIQPPSPLPVFAFALFPSPSS
jgi:hypothetical protein